MRETPARCARCNMYEDQNFRTSEKKRKISIPELYTDESKSSTTRSDVEKTNVLTNFFFVECLQKTVPRLPNTESYDAPELNTITITLGIVKKIK